MDKYGISENFKFVIKINFKKTYHVDKYMV